MSHDQFPEDHKSRLIRQQWEFVIWFGAAKQLMNSFIIIDLVTFTILMVKSGLYIQLLSSNIRDAKTSNKLDDQEVICSP